MEGWIVFLAGIGLMVSEIVTRVKPTLTPGQKHPHQLRRYELTAYIRVLVLGIVSMLAILPCGQVLVCSGTSPGCSLIVDNLCHPSPSPFRHLTSPRETNVHAQEDPCPKNSWHRCYSWSTYPLGLLMEAPACLSTPARC